MEASWGLIALNNTEVCACCEGNGYFMRGIQIVKCEACEGKGYIGYMEEEKNDKN